MPTGPALRAGTSPPRNAFPQLFVSMGQRGRPQASRRHARERASLRPSWRMRPERHSRLCLHTSPVRNPPRCAHLTGSSVQPARHWTCGCVLGPSRAVIFSRTFANMAPRFETRPENAESAAFESSVQQPVVRKRPHPTSTSLSNSIVKHGVLPLAGFAADVRAIIGRDVDVTTTSLLRDEVRRSALAEAVPL